MENKSEVTYVTGIATWGFLNGVMNVAFTTAQFLPEFSAESGEMEITPAIVVSANLRMDLSVVQQLRDACTAILDQNTKPKVEH